MNNQHPPYINLRIDTDAANEIHGQVAIDGVDPLEFLAAVTEASESGHVLPTPDTPIQLMFGDIQKIAEQVKALQIDADSLHSMEEQVKALQIDAEQFKALQLDADNLRGMVKDLNIKIEEEKMSKSCDIPLAHSGSILRNHSNAAINFTPRRDVGALPLTPTVATVPGLPATPTTSRGTSSSHQPCSGREIGGSGRNRHRRNQTPLQSSIRRMMGGQPVYTIGLRPQEDRNLINDFFSGIGNWAKDWTVKTRMLAPDEVAQLSDPDSAVCTLLGLAGDSVSALLWDECARPELVAAIVARKIVDNTLCDTFLFSSDLPEVADLVKLLDEYKARGPQDVTEKHQLLLAQKALYTQIKENEGHRKWRLDMAKKLGDDLVEKLGPLVCEDPATVYMDTPDRDGILQELIIKGYRIGFRMRMETHKWLMSWPFSGEDFEPYYMVNVSRNLHGNPTKTWERVMQSPRSYSVCFALSPVITKADYSTGAEKWAFEHNSMVHIVRKPNFVGSERAISGHYNVNTAADANGNATVRGRTRRY